MTTKILATLFATTAFLAINTATFAGLNDDDAPQVSVPKATPRDAHYKVITETLDEKYKGLGTRLVNFAKTKEGQVWDERVARLAAPETLTLFTKEDYWIKYGDGAVIADQLQAMKDDQNAFLLGSYAPVLTKDANRAPSELIERLGKWNPKYVADFFDHAGQLLHMGLSDTNFQMIRLAIESVPPAQMTACLDAINKYASTLFNTQMNGDDRSKVIQMVIKLSPDNVDKFCSEIPTDWGLVIKKDGLRDIVSALDHLNPQVALAIIQNAKTLFPTEMNSEHRVALINERAMNLYRTATVILPTDAAPATIASDSAPAAPTKTTETASSSAPAAVATTTETTSSSAPAAVATTTNAPAVSESATTDDDKKPTRKKRKKRKKRSGPVELPV